MMKILTAPSPSVLRNSSKKVSTTLENRLDNNDFCNIESMTTKTLVKQNQERPFSGMEDIDAPHGDDPVQIVSSF